MFDLLMTILFPVLVVNFFLMQDWVMGGIGAAIWTFWMLLRWRPVREWLERKY